MSRLMRCLYCGVLQDEPAGAKTCARCGGELAPEVAPPSVPGGSYLQAQLELDQVQAPAGQNVERYLLLTLRTPAQVPPEHAVAETGRPPLHLAAVLDVSGSMGGEKLAYAKEALQRALHFLRQGDAISLVTFSTKARGVIEPTSFSAERKRQVQSLLHEIAADATTALDDGLAMGIEYAGRERRETTLVLLFSDGLANEGETDLEKIGQRAAKARSAGILVSTLGVGDDYNEALMAEVAVQGGGRFYHIQQAAEIPACLMRELGEAALLGARQTVVELDLPAGAAAVSVSPYYRLEQQGQTARLEVGDITLDTELEIPLRLVLPAQSAGTRLGVSGRVRYLSPVGREVGGPLNGVTVRFVEAGEFERRLGVVAPVVERVAAVRRAAAIFTFARQREIAPGEAPQVLREEVESLREYVALVSEEKAQEIERELTEDAAPAAHSPAAKQRMMPAIFRIRGDFSG